jgi:hypothetical protein
VPARNRNRHSYTVQGGHRYDQCSRRRKFAGAFAAGNFSPIRAPIRSLSARAHLERAVLIVAQTELPLAAWRVHAAASLHERTGERDKAAESRRLSREVTDRLAENLGQEDPLRAKFVAGYAAESRR